MLAVFRLGPNITVGFESSGGVANLTSYLTRTSIRIRAKGLFGPFIFCSAATSAGITQALDVPESWSQGAEGYGHRFGNYLAKQAVQRRLRLAGEEMLHEDNRYFQSGSMERASGSFTP